MIIINSTLDHMYNSLGVLEKSMMILFLVDYYTFKHQNDETGFKKLSSRRTKTRISKIHVSKSSLSFIFIINTAVGTKTDRIYSKKSFFEADYNFKNFLNWYFVGKRQLNIKMQKSIVHFLIIDRSLKMR